MFFSCVQKKKARNTHSNIIYLKVEKSEKRNVVQVPAPLHTSCAAMGKSIHLTVPRFPHL